MTRTIDERRRSERYQCDCDAKWSYFNREGALDARISNVSDNGCYVLVDRPMIPGATVTLRVMQYRGVKSSSMGAPRTNTVAEVKWCHLIEEGSTPFYGAGVKYHYPV